MIRIGILTYHRSKNYGAFLQAYALCNRLNQEKNIDAKIIDFNTLKADQYYNKKYSLKETIKNYKYVNFHKKLNKAFDKTINKLILTKSSVINDDFYEMLKFIKYDFDIIISGSDEIWKIDNLRGFPSAYWLPFKFKGKKISYAA